MYPCSTGAGPASITKDGQLITCRPPLPLQWADLYLVWNIAFVTEKFPDFPYFLPKLLIPSVSGYQAHPETFLVNRAIALNIFINWKLNRLNRNYMKLNWRIPDLIRDMGKMNSRSAEDYLHRLSYALKTTLDQVKDAPEPDLLLEIVKFNPLTLIID